MFNYIAIGVGVLGVAFGVRCYLELWRWAKQCQRASIAIAYNRRVQLNAPLAEWLTWANQLNNEESARGRTVYRNGKVTVALLRPNANMSATTTVKRIRRFRRARKEKLAA